MDGCDRMDGGESGMSKRAGSDVAWIVWSGERFLSSSVCLLPKGEM